MGDGHVLAAALRDQAQNNEMIDSSYTLSGQLLNEAADILEILEGSLDDLKADLDKYHTFLKDEARSTWVCEKCGHRKSAYGCLWCRIKALQARVRDLEREQKAWTQR